MSFPASWSRLLSKHPALLASSTIGILLVAVPTIRLIRLHQHLEQVITNFYSTGPYAKEAARTSTHAELPDSISSSPDDYRVFYDVSTKSVAQSLLPKCDYEKMLTFYLRRNMTAFSRLPQAYSLWLMASKEDKLSFGKDYLSKLDFSNGDLVNGSYRVISRHGGLCVFSMSHGPVEGRLVISIENETKTLDGETGVWMLLPQVEAQGEASEREMIMFKNETFMWVPKNEKTVMSMERTLARWLHETSAWWLMDSGIRWLSQTENKYK